jgi:hypothetical protein
MKPIPVFRGGSNNIKKAPHFHMWSPDYSSRETLLETLLLKKELRRFRGDNLMGI